jgi:hypothetical protein
MTRAVGRKANKKGSQSTSLLSSAWYEMPMATTALKTSAKP